MSTKKLAKRLDKFSGSATSAINSKLEELRRAGQEIISLNIGEPDFITPDHIRFAGIKAITDGFTKYTRTNGILELRTAIADKLLRDNNISYKPNEICITNGAKQAISNSIMAVCDEGDEVIIPVPCWVSYTEMVKLSGAKPIQVKCRDDFSLDLNAIEAAITPATKAIIICTPNNPSGAVYSEESLRALADLAVKYDFFVITDEIYEKIIYDDYKHFSIASISQEVWERTITVNGCSKAYAMTGWRMGYVAARQDIIKAIMKIQSQTTSSTCAIAQKAALAAVSLTQEPTDEMVKVFWERRDYVCKRISEIPGLSCPKPHGAFYVLVDVRSYFGKKCGDIVINNAIDLTAYLLDKVHVSVVQGEAYNIAGYIRISYATSMDDLKRALDSIQSALAELQ